MASTKAQKKDRAKLAQPNFTRTVDYALTKDLLDSTKDQRIACLLHIYQYYEGFVAIRHRYLKARLPQNRRTPAQTAGEVLR